MRGYAPGLMRCLLLLLLIVLVFPTASMAEHANEPGLHVIEIVVDSPHDGCRVPAQWTHRFVRGGNEWALAAGFVSPLKRFQGAKLMVLFSEKQKERTVNHLVSMGAESSLDVELVDACGRSLGHNLTFTIVDDEQLTVHAAGDGTSYRALLQGDTLSFRLQERTVSITFHPPVQHNEILRFKVMH